MSLTLAIMIRNRARELRLTLASMVHHSGEVLKAHKDDIELLIIDGGSDDNIRGVLRDFADYFNVRFVSMDIHKSGLEIASSNAAIGTNLCFLLAKKDHVLKFQPETLFLKDNIGFMFNTMPLVDEVPFADTSCGSRYTSNEDVLGAEFNIPLIDDAAHHINQPGVEYTLGRCAHLGSILVTNVDKAAFFPYVWACSRDLFLKSGLVDVDFMSGWAAEDDYLMLRLAQAGGHLHVTGDMAAFHMWHRNRKLAGGLAHRRNARLLDSLRDVSAEKLRVLAARNKKISLQCVVSES